jgi:hypothetical protein
MPAPLLALFDANGVLAASEALRDESAVDPRLPKLPVCICVATFVQVLIMDMPTPAWEARHRPDR